MNWERFTDEIGQTLQKRQRVFSFLRLQPVANRMDCRQNGFLRLPAVNKLIRTGKMKTALLLVAYGCGQVQSRLALRSFEAFCRRRFPGLPVRWAISSMLWRERLARERAKSDSVLKALSRLRLENFGAVAVQPLQMIPGREYGQILEAAESMRESIGCAVGAPLLGAPADAARAAAALLPHLPPERRPEEDVVFMGHGARHPAATLYRNLYAELAARDGKLHVGTMSDVLPLEDLLPRLASKRVWLMPLFSVVGRHAQRDMAGSQPESWRSRIEAAGHLCQPWLRGAAEHESVAAIWLEHLAVALESLSGSFAGKAIANS